MTERGPDWAALRRVFARLSPTSGEVPSAVSPGAVGATDKDKALARDLAEERAAIMEYDGGMSRTEAEAHARKVYGVRLSKRSK
ncbi:hypothetical protein QKW60_08280 [Defluviimonas aestuarii]|uniref:hypothetical protein n=1 Tax=Albidovulum aestuarii TaxID=1130726 RepID=UPI00249C5666|nr:hypothetical protein [Defluviimonas aestuarii]MDI3336399.1 hypothetical protein [Defluviimonas aestuarii]